MDSFDFDGAFRILFKGGHEISFMTFIVGRNVGVVIEVSILDHKESLVTEDARFTALFDYFR